jgi:hypothetical protein
MCDIITKTDVLARARIDKEAIKTTVTHSYRTAPGKVDGLIHEWYGVSMPCLGDQSARHKLTEMNEREDVAEKLCRKSCWSHGGGQTRRRCD